jgi:hypothetical protein
MEMEGVESSKGKASHKFEWDSGFITQHKGGSDKARRGSTKSTHAKQETVFS